MMATIAARLFGFVVCFLFGTCGAGVYWLTGHSDKAIPHAIVWLVVAWLLQPAGDDSARFYAWLDAKMKQDGIAAR